MTSNYESDDRPVLGDPKCPTPNCKAGMDRIVATPSRTMKDAAGNPLFAVVNCAKCGHVFGVIGNQHAQSGDLNLRNFL